MIGPDFQYREKIPVGILGATGSVGQQFAQLLHSHPWFDLKALAASERSVGKPYSEAACWQAPEPLPLSIAHQTVQPMGGDFPCKILFSALDSSAAGSVEAFYRKKGYAVVSNCKNHRMDDDVPLLVPEVNPGHLDLLRVQKNVEGLLATNPNCSVIGLALALKPLDEAFGIEKVQVVTMQAISGAGFKGRQSMDIADNVIPYISGEEEKIETEIKKIFGSFSHSSIAYKDFCISAQCNRVPVSDGHLLSVAVKLKRKPAPEEVIKAWEEFKSVPQTLSLPTAPAQPVHYFKEESYPQTKLHRNLEKGMAVSVGRLRSCPIHDYKFVVLSHNTVRGAAGGSVLIAELMVKQGLVYW